MLRLYQSPAEVHRVVEAALGQEHPPLIVPFNNLATTYIKVSRFDEASAETRNRRVPLIRLFL
jgi:hypothetical protein